MDALIGTRKGLFALDGDALDLVGFAGVPVTAASYDRRDGTTYAALDHGHFGVKVHRSDDGGATFTELAPPAYPDRPADSSDTDPVRGDERVLDDADAVDVGTGSSRRAGRVGRARSPAACFAPTTGASRGSWSGRCGTTPPVPSGSVAATTTLAFTRSRSILARRRTSWSASRAAASGARPTAVRRGTSPPSGLRAGYMPPELADIPAIQDPHRLAACRDHPDVVWCQHHSGMFRSTDGGSVWTEIVDVSPSTFGFAVAAHPADPDIAWFVPAKSDEVRIPVDGHMVVTRTRDGGASFEVLDTGLPADRTYHLVYRHAFDVDDQGERLLLGSTTGGLWASDDQGDTFRQFDAGLPQVNCVAFT